MSTILVAEDEYKIARSLQDILEYGGHEVRLARDGKEAWRQVHSVKPDLIFADINMPHMNGYELLEHVRNDQQTETTPFVFLTAREQREDIRRGMFLGADDFITKPFTAKEILDVITSTLEKRQKLNHKHDTSLKLLRKNISYSLPHELRTPLQSVIGYADLMHMDYNRMSPEDVKMMSGMILKSGERLQRLIENTVIYSQLELIATDPQKQKALRNHILADPADRIMDTAELVASKWTRFEDLRLTLSDGLIRISKENLTRIIEELVDNAFKFSEQGSPVTVKTLHKEHQYTIIVCDEGRGMSSKQMEQIGAFIQFDRNLHEQQGSGLGLAIVKRLVEMHNGQFNIRSAFDKGTMVTIQFNY